MKYRLNRHIPMGEEYLLFDETGRLWGEIMKDDPRDGYLVYFRMTGEWSWYGPPDKPWTKKRAKEHLINLIERWIEKDKLGQT